MAQLSVYECDTLSPDLDEPVSGEDYRTHRYFRHLYFLHYCLGEPWSDAFIIASRLGHVPLPISAMEHVAGTWDLEEDDYDKLNPNSVQAV